MVIAIGFLFFGACTLWYGWALQRSRNRVLSWPQIEGQIQIREVSLSTRAGKTSVSAFRYEALVKYVYRVHGVEYEGDNIYPLGWVTSSYKNRKKFLDQIPDRPLVRYDPENPGTSCLYLPSLGWIFLGYGMGTVLSAIGALALLVKIL